MSYLPLAGVGVIVVGFGLRLNPFLVVVVAGLTSGFAAGMGVRELLAAFGEGLLDNRFLGLFLLTLPVLGVLERYGLRGHAATWIRRYRRLTATRLLVMYLALRQLSSALGLNGLGGHAQTVRPLLAPMAEGAAEQRAGTLADGTRNELRAMAAATDNVGLFFGEDIFIAFGAVLLIKGVYADNGIDLEPLAIAVWGIPTALCAFAIHAWRLHRFGRRLRGPEDASP